FYKSVTNGVILKYEKLEEGPISQYLLVLIFLQCCSTADSRFQRSTPASSGFSRTTPIGSRGGIQVPEDLLIGPATQGALYFPFNFLSYLHTHHHHHELHTLTVFISTLHAR